MLQPGFEPQTSSQGKSGQTDNATLSPTQLISEKVILNGRDVTIEMSVQFSMTRYMTVEIKIKKYKAVVRLIMTYGAETRAATTKTKQLLRATEMNTLRAVLGKTRSDRMKNVDILERCSLQEVAKFVKSGRKAWNEHVSRAEQRLIKLVRDDRPNTKRPPGRPPKPWADSWRSSFTGTP